MRALNVPCSTTPSRCTTEKPGSVNVTVYSPGRRFSIAYCPVPSVTVDRTFSMSAGLDASTVTPGSTAPDASRTSPLIAACANAAAGSSSASTNTSPIFFIICTPISTVYGSLEKDRTPILRCNVGNINGGRRQSGTLRHRDYEGARCPENLP
jgi:hypothetical protein